MSRYAGIILLTAILAACCRDPVGGVLLINDTPETITVEVDGSGNDPWTIAPGRDDVPFGPLGDASLLIRAVERSWEHQVVLTSEHLLVVPASKDVCIALANYIDQYGGDGKVEVMLTASAAKPGSIRLDGELYLGVDDPLPKEIYPDTPVRRFTRVPCGRIGQELALKSHLWALD